VNLKKYGVDLRALFTFDDLRNAAGPLSVDSP
jgi:hypothetical protein